MNTGDLRDKGVEAQLSTIDRYGRNHGTKKSVP